MTDHDMDQAAAYVLDALGPEEREAFEEHMSTCAACRQEVATLRQVVDALPLAVEPAVPPDSLRHRIVSALDEDAGRPLVALPGGAPARSRATGPSSRALRLLAPLISVAAVIALVGLGLWNVRLQQQVHTRSLAQQVVQAEAQPGTVTAHLPGTGPARGATAHVVDPPSGRSAYVIMSHVPTPPKGKVYQMWVMNAHARPVSAGIFVQGVSGQTVWKIARPAGHYRLTAFTVEPGPHGSPAPTTKPIMIGRFTA